MNFDVGLLDRLFGKRTTFQIPGPGGLKEVSVTERWLAKMIAEGKIEPVDANLVIAHVIDPAGAARAAHGLAGPTHEYYTTRWVIGEDVSQEQVNQFRDPSTAAIYVLVKYENGVPQRFVVRRDFWENAKAKLGIA
jgi:hypothetical protein